MTGRGNRQYSLELMLMATIYTVQKQGRYLKRTEARAGEQQPTATLAFELVAYSTPKHWTAEDVAAFESQRDALRDRAQAALVWARSIKPANEYETTIRDIARRGVFTKTAGKNELGHAASIWPSYERSRARDPIAEPTAEYVGSVGQRIEFDATVSAVVPTFGPFGLIARVDFLDDEGRRLVWWSSQPAKMPRELRTGSRVAVKGTVKSQEFYIGRHQTTLTRCKVALVEATEPLPEPQEHGS